jgi:hypothetical protein
MATTSAPAPVVTNGSTPAAPRERAPRSPLLARLTSLTTVATMLIGVFAVVGGNYGKHVVHDQLVPQKIFFPPSNSPALLPGIKQYAGQQLTTGAQAKAYANNFINVHLAAVAGGKTYSQVSTLAKADPKNATLAGQKQTLFMGESLRGLLLGAWGWSLVASIATFAGILLILLGAVLFILPLANWQINGRRTAAA